MTKLKIAFIAILLATVAASQIVRYSIGSPDSYAIEVPPQTEKMTERASLTEESIDKTSSENNKEESMLKASTPEIIYESTESTTHENIDTSADTSVTQNITEESPAEDEKEDVSEQPATEEISKSPDEAEPSDTATADSHDITEEPESEVTSTDDEAVSKPQTSDTDRTGEVSDEVSSYSVYEFCEGRYPKGEINEKIYGTKDDVFGIKENINGGFMTASSNNNKKVTFGKTLSDGISLKCGDIDITIVPEVEGEFSDATRPGGGYFIEYAGDNNTSYMYGLHYDGFWQEIFVKQYTGQTDFKFRVYTNGLTPCQYVEKDYFLADDTGEYVINLGAPISFTADERNNTFVDVKCETIRANEEYLFTLHLDEEYLSSEKTAHPLYFDFGASIL